MKEPKEKRSGTSILPYVLIVEPLAARRGLPWTLLRICFEDAGMTLVKAPVSMRNCRPDNLSVTWRSLLDVLSAVVANARAEAIDDRLFSFPNPLIRRPRR